MIDLPPLPLRIGYDRARVVRSAVLLLALATAVAVILALSQSGRPTPLGRLLQGYRVGSVPLLALAVEAVALFVVAVAVSAAWRRRDFLVLREDGIEFHNHDGVFLVEWENVALLERAAAGYVGIRLRDPARLLTAHAGTSGQRERLTRLEPHGAYHLILHPEQLPCGVEQFVTWARALRSRH